MEASEIDRNGVIKKTTVCVLNRPFVATSESLRLMMPSPNNGEVP
jgi:hypothetical protein